MTRKVYLCTVESCGPIYHEVSGLMGEPLRFDVQNHDRIQLPEGSSIDPPGPALQHLNALGRFRLRAGAVAYVTVTTTAEGHAAMFDAGFRPPLKRAKSMHGTDPHVRFHLSTIPFDHPDVEAH